MLFRVYNITFPRNLDEAERHIFVGEIQCVVEHWQHEFDRIIKKFDRREMMLLRVIPAANLPLDIIRASLNEKKISITNYVRLGQEDHDLKTYKLCIAYYDLSLIKNKINIFGKEYNIRAGQIVDDAKLMNHIKDRIFPLMGFRKSQVKIAIAEEEMA